MHASLEEYVIVGLSVRKNYFGAVSQAHAYAHTHTQAHTDKHRQTGNNL